MPSVVSELDVAKLRSLGTRRVGATIRHLAAVSSTMDEARLMAEAGAPDGAVIVAESQTHGRGRFGRPWVSGPGSDLAFSVVLRPRASYLRSVNMAAALAVQEAAAELTSMCTELKWPNDVVISGRKVSGILVETLGSSDCGLSHVVVGVGLNVNLRPSEYPEIAGIATSLSELADHPFDRTEVLSCVLVKLDDLYDRALAGEDLHKAWASRIETIGRLVTVSMGDRLLIGRARCVDGDGHLVVEDSEGRLETVVAGEVTLSGND